MTPKLILYICRLGEMQAMKIEDAYSLIGNRFEIVGKNGNGDVVRFIVGEDFFPDWPNRKNGYYVETMSSGGIFVPDKIFEALFTQYADGQ